MKIGFISLSVPGHFNPMSAVARQLQSRQNDVVVLSLPAIAKTNGLSRVASLLEEAFGLTKKVS